MVLIKTYGGLKDLTRNTRWRPSITTTDWLIWRSNDSDTGKARDEYFAAWVLWAKDQRRWEKTLKKQKRLKKLIAKKSDQHVAILYRIVAIKKKIAEMQFFSTNSSNSIEDNDTMKNLRKELKDLDTRLKEPNIRCFLCLAADEAIIAEFRLRQERQERQEIRLKKYTQRCREFLQNKSQNLPRNDLVAIYEAQKIHYKDLCDKCNKCKGKSVIVNYARLLFFNENDFQVQVLDLQICPMCGE